MKRLFGIVILVLLSALVSACASQEEAIERPTFLTVTPIPESEVDLVLDGKMLDQAPATPPGIGQVAPDFQFTLADGTTQKLSDLRGKKVLINFWATWCGPCQVEMPEMEYASHAYEKDDLVILAINRSETPETIRPFAASFGITFPIVVNTSNDIGEAYGIRGLPTSYFINGDGTVNYIQIGVVSIDLIETRLEEMN
jgi:thiol-disulfide isomerase/thioredoxin